MYYFVFRKKGWEHSCGLEVLSVVRSGSVTRLPAPALIWRLIWASETPVGVCGFGVGPGRQAGFLLLWAVGSSIHADSSPLSSLPVNRTAFAHAWVPFPAPRWGLAGPPGSVWWCGRCTSSLLENQLVLRPRDSGACGAKGVIEPDMK